ncbi:MAG: prolyl oligopeptidase family serine peptidase [Planctomycetaceae bacterium]|nr:prolyl oligopeptidase family serine peptidase [Planctomycetaceae bacterium]
MARLRPVAVGSVLVLWFVSGMVASARADGPADNNPETVRRVPKLGVEVPAEDKSKLQAGLDDLKASIGKLAESKNPKTLALLPDIRIYWEAVNTALTYQEFFDAKEIPVAYELLKEGQERASQLAKGEAPWTTATGLVVRGYVSKIDGSVQPYGLVVPESFNPKSPYRHRLDLWFHGRGETLSEVNFLQNRRKSVGQFAPEDTIVLHPYGRYSNANKFAGEVDVFEAMEDVKKRYRIDEDRITVRGFSMGGASTWQLAVHYPTLWAAANPGAGFSETPKFLEFFQKETLKPTWWEEKLWQWYDCDKWAWNLLMCPTVAYSGEKDIQKQAADVMETALAESGIRLVHIIGPGTGHSYHPESARQVEASLRDIVRLGRNRVPEMVALATPTLKYNQSAWVTIDGLDSHWEPASISASMRVSGKVHLEVHGVTAFTINFPAGTWPGAAPEIQVTETVSDHHQPINQTFKPSKFIRSDRSAGLSFHQRGLEWVEGEQPPSKSRLRKVHGLQGPIDDAFLDGFVFVRPTGQAKYEKTDAWARGELDRAIEHWRRHFRGQARVKDDKDITEADIAGMNLVLWGDPSSNAVFAKIADRLPIRYDGDKLIVKASADGKTKERSFDATHHAPILIYPNPLNPKKYVVLNSSFTFREYAYLNNARQVPMLPDWAIVDLRTPPGNVWPGKIADADFFDEEWQVKAKR